MTKLNFTEFHYSFINFHWSGPPASKHAEKKRRKQISKTRRLTLQWCRGALKPSFVLITVCCSILAKNMADEPVLYKNLSPDNRNKIRSLSSVLLLSCMYPLLIHGNQTFWKRTDYTLAISFLTHRNPFFIHFKEKGHIEIDLNVYVNLMKRNIKTSFV